MARIGRNDPCPCGSGKKYKHCCYGKTVQQMRPETPWAQDAEWNKIRSAEGELVPAVLDFALGRYGKDLFEEALEEFVLWGEYPVEDVYFDNFFIPWFVFNWVPRDRETGPASRALPEQPLGLEYLQQNARQLDKYQQAFIRVACRQPFSFFAITDVIAGKSLGLRDLFLGRTFTVKEAGASKMLRHGDIIFARVVALDDQAIVVGMAPIALPPSEHLNLLDFRDNFKKHARGFNIELNLTTLLYADTPMRRAYLGAVELLSNPQQPELQNTDGDPLSFIKVYFELGCSPQEALEDLKSLVLPEFHHAILEDSVHDAEGNLLEVSFDWQKKGNKLHKQWDNTTLGHVTIKGKELTAEVNSEKRAKKIRSEITKRLGKKAGFKRALYESVEQKLEEMKEQPDSEDARREREELESLPEVQAILKQEIEAHWEEWPNRRLPALQNKTPLQAARTKAGRERLEALLWDFERRNEDVTQPHLRVDVEAIRKKLGLHVNVEVHTE